ncbi:MAG TPA: alanine--tRNA ligase [Candidatus Thermoplasmatota archaeon]|nr:alanine--tRNA ligase [Candidatus Thermoplasmatota archaeon]
MSLEQEYQLDFFKTNGFTRKQCTGCKMFFWSQDKAREKCGDPPCVEYQFIGNPATKKEYTLREMRETYLKFLEERGHTRVKRYPVVARWREDIYLTIASIADFQPHVTSGAVPPPANPLAISQPCIRLNDLDSVGKSGRHLTTFEMMAHHVFNYPGKTIYFKNDTVRLCHEFLTQALGMNGAEVSYKENPWAGGGNAGPAIEVLIRGLEVATLVFMKWVEDPAGPIDLKGERYREMDLQIVDTGYGLERLTWISNGRSTIYDALFPDTVAFLMDAAGLAHIRGDPKYAKLLAETARMSSIMSVDTGTKVLELRKKVHARAREQGLDISFEDALKVWEPLEKVYALSDHARCIAFMLGDGIVPSNVKAGYLARMVIRKSLRLMDELGLQMTFMDIVDRQLVVLGADFPELKANRDHIAKVLALETERYRETMEKGRRLVEREAKALKGKGMDVEKLISLYDSQGLAPDIVKAVAEPLGVTVDIPDDFYSRVAERHSKEKPAAPAAEKAQNGHHKKLEGLPPTKLLYYQDSTTKEFNAVVLWAKDNEVVLDQTAFYPEGGGQPADGGFLVTEGDSFEVKDVQKVGNVVVHTIDGKLKVGAMVRGRVDWGKRMAHTRHHTATHIILGSARRVLGPHAWQAGAQKGYDRSRVDIAHYQRITDEELREIEQLANMVVLENLPVTKEWLPRDEAEKKYGFQLYQGGIPAGNQIRVVKIQDFDVEACAGTHVRGTQEVGAIKLVRTERIQDGIERIEFTAGLAAVKHMQRQTEILQEAATVLSVTPEEVPKTATKFFEEWKQLRKENEDMRARLAKLEAASFKPDLEVTVEGQAVVFAVKGGMDANALRNLAAEYAKNTPKIVAVVAPTGQFIVTRSAEATGNAVPVAKALAEGRAGGKPDLAQGSIPNVAPGTTEAQMVEMLRKKFSA